MMRCPFSHSDTPSPTLAHPLLDRAARHDVFSAERHVKILLMPMVAAAEEVLDRMDEEGAGGDGEKKE